MRFISKNPRYSVTLRPSIPGNPAMAVPGTPSVRLVFNEGLCTVSDDDVRTIEMAKANRSFNVDYFEEGSDEEKACPKIAFRGEAAHKVFNPTPASADAEVKALKEQVGHLSEQLSRALSILESKSKEPSKDPVREHSKESEKAPQASVDGDSDVETSVSGGGTRGGQKK